MTATDNQRDTAVALVRGGMPRAHAATIVGGTLVGALVGVLASAVVAAAYHHPAELVGALAAVGALVGAIVGAIAHHRRARTVSVDVTRVDDTRVAARGRLARLARGCVRVSVDDTRVDDTRVDAAQARRRICRLAAGLELARCTAGAEWGPMNEEDGDRAQILRLRESAILAGVRGLA